VFAQLGQRPVTALADLLGVEHVLDGVGQPLDLGRQARTVPDGMRRAVTATGGCARPGCTRPPSWCAIHHIHEWELGGETALSNLVMLCSAHHREIHSSGWIVRIAADGLPEFIPRLWIDLEQKPRRNPGPVAPFDTGDHYTDMRGAVQSCGAGGRAGSGLRVHAST
jgi:hypothetical protein